MTKTGKVLLGFMIVCAVFVVGGRIYLSLPKNPITVSQFKSSAIEFGYEVIDFSEENGVCKVVSKDKDYQIEFYEFEETKDAKSTYLEYKANIEAKKGGVSTNLEWNVINSNHYALTSNGFYMVTSRIGKTVIYVETNEMYKEEIKTFMKKIGY